VASDKKPMNTQPTPILNSLNSLERLRVAEPSLDPNALHGPLGKIIETIEPDTEAHPAAILIHALIGMGNLMGRGPYFQVQDTRHYTNLNAVVCGNSATARKGYSAGIAKRILSQIDPDWLMFNKKSGLQSGEAIVAHLQDQPATNPPTPQDKRLFLLEEEFAQVLQACKGKSNVSAIIRKSWDGDQLALLTKKNSITATDCHISIIGHITRKELRKLLSSNDSSNGFGNRFLWIFSKGTKLLPHPTALNLQAVNKELQMLKSAVSNAESMGEVEIQRSSQADLLWKDLYNELNDLPEGLYGDAISRGPAQVMRLALLYCLLDGQKTIEVSHLVAAKALWNYSRDSARWVFDDYVVSDNAIKVLKVLDDRKQLTGTDIFRIHNNKLSAEGKQAILNEIRDEIEIEIQKTGGRDEEIIRKKAA
jgi:hypothetical protein